MKHALVLAAALGLSACASTDLAQSDAAFLAQAAIVGKSRAELVACAGTPESTEVKGDTEALHYSSASGKTVLMVGAGDKMISNEPYACRVTFVLRRGFVEDVVYTGRTGRTALNGGEECAPVVSKCVRPRN